MSADANAVAERLATILGLFVALVELLGGLSFAAKCHKTSGGFAGVLTVVMVVALVWHLKNLSF